FLDLGTVEAESLENVLHEAELFVAFLEVSGHLRRQLSRRKVERRDLDVVGMRGRLFGRNHRRFLGRNRALLGGVLRWLGHGRGLHRWQWRDPIAFAPRTVSPSFANLI